MKSWHVLGASLLAATLLSACGGDSDNDNNDGNNGDNGGDTVTTPDSIKLSWLSHYQAGSFDESAAEITAYDSVSQRLFVVNAEQGVLDVLDLSDPGRPQKIDSLSAADVAADAEVNSVAAQNGLVAVAILPPLR